MMYVRALAHSICRSEDSRKPLATDWRRETKLLQVAGLLLARTSLSHACRKRIVVLSGDLTFFLLSFFSSLSSSYFLNKWS